MEQIGHRWGMQWAFSDALPQMLLQLFLFKNQSFISLNYRIFKKLKFLACLWFRSTVHPPASRQPIRWLLKLNAEARGEGTLSPFRLGNAIERLPIVTSLWEPPITTTR